MPHETVERRAYLMVLMVLESGDGAYALPDYIKRYTCLAPSGDSFTVSQGSVSHTYTNAHSNLVPTTSKGAVTVSIETTGTLYLILFKSN